MRTTTRTRICRRRKDQPNWFSHRVLWRRLPSVTLAETFSASFKSSNTSGGPTSQRELNIVQTLVTTEASMKPSRQCTALLTRCRVLCAVRTAGCSSQKRHLFWAAGLSISRLSSVPTESSRTRQSSVSLGYQPKWNWTSHHLWKSSPKPQSS